MRFKSAHLLILLFFKGSAVVEAQLADGIYAVFHTNMGSFTARLAYAEAPLTVANFVGLAEGTQTWIEEESGWHRVEPFFDGTIVNRIADIPERIIQTGSRNGTNSGGGPGYTFPDEFHPSLRHNKPGILSMANSGPNSNSSQYFFTLGALPGLDDRHAVFGEVITGLDVLTRIGDVSLFGSKPIDDVVFEQVQIVRVGVEAVSFDVEAQGLPFVHRGLVEIAYQAPHQAEVSYRVPSNTEYVVHVSSNLVSSTELERGWQIDSVRTNSHLFPAGASTQFYSVSRVSYEQPILTPVSVSGGRFLASGGELDIQPASDGTAGIIRANGGQLSGSLTSWSWTQEAYRGILFIVYDTIVPPAMRLNFVFTNATSGVYSGSALEANGSTAFRLDGEFSFTPPESSF